ncbi:unnamed protein product [Heligmosomoides polygyrus]|uniref:YqaE/Pmp3 family membrane protein n=1 Tax=Heligmosomoides polygyrus TaxID=6339 RepID=A0A183GTN9_HELPZ|nr:unnamed protein product [Heligmosomoides polygyrus]
MNLPWLLILAIFCPPLAVFIDWGCSYHLAVNIFLTGFVWVVGISHAWFMCIAFSAMATASYLMKLAKGDAPEDKK